MMQCGHYIDERTETYFKIYKERKYQKKKDLKN